jgi:hypothetical protein
MPNNILFFQPDLDEMLSSKKRQCQSLVEQIPKDQFLISSDDEVAANVAAQMTVAPLALDEAASTMQQSEANVDVSGDYRRAFMRDHEGPFYVPGTRVVVSVPFTGDYWIFQYRTNPYSSLFPRAEVRGSREGGTLQITIARPHDAPPEEFKATLDRELKLVRECVDRANKQVEGHNSSLVAHVKAYSVDRRARLGKHAGLADLLNIPVAPREGAPTIKPVKLEVVRPPPLPPVPKGGVQPEPGIRDEDYEQILHFIRHQGRTFETTPRTYAVHDEEGLRDIILGQLNGHFRGGAAGEVFRRAGKTDIRIEADNRAAFVGECKLWSGAGGIGKALDQLLGYLTWRDSKAALVVFNKSVKSFSSTVLPALPEAVRAHECFVRDLACSEQGEWRFQMRSVEDEGRRVTVHAFAFNLHAS